MRTISKFLSTAALAACVSTGFAQANLGADCGCPAVASRPEVNLSTKGTDATYTTASGNLIPGRVISHSITLFCDTTYILDSKIYIDSTVTLTIKPGTVIKGASVPSATPWQANALIIQKGAKINAVGTETSPIVFTAVGDDLNGSITYAQKGLWGGLVILGRAKNNLILTNTKMCVGKNGQGFVEGFDKANARNLFGGNDDNDNSGTLRYVSVRHSGAIIASGNELNGISLGSVGRGTTIDHIEVVASDDDGVELFGGTVNISHVAVMFGNDDMIDYDLGWTGKAQFLFGIDAPETVAKPSDNGFEADGDDDNSGATPYTTATICNATMIGNNESTWSNDQSGSAGFMAKENVRGAVYNSLFVNYVYGLVLCTKTTSDAYVQWTSGGFQFKNNSFINVKKAFTYFNGNAKPESLYVASKTVASAADSTTLFTTHANNRIAAPAGFDYAYDMGTADKFDVIPNSNIGNTAAGVCPVAAPYRGAFEAGKPSWLSKWSSVAALNVSTGMVSCDADNTGDGAINGDDFLKLLSVFGQSCN